MREEREWLLYGEIQGIATACAAMGLVLMI